jgi:hypothetical protein
VVLNQFTLINAPFGKSKIEAQTSQSIMLASISDTAYTQGADPLWIEIRATNLVESQTRTFHYQNQNSFTLCKYCLTV